MMKKILLGMVCLISVLGLELIIWGLISGDRFITLIGFINLVLAGTIGVGYYMFKNNASFSYFYRYWQQYGRTVLIMIWMWSICKFVIMGIGIYSVIVLSVLVIGAWLIQGKLIGLYRGKTQIPNEFIIVIVSCMVVLIVFQKHRVDESPRLIVSAFAGGRLVYAIGLAILGYRTIVEPLLITRGLLTTIAAIRATTVTIVDTYQENIIEKVVYEDKEVYLPAKYCLPQWGNPQLVNIVEQ